MTISITISDLCGADLEEATLLSEFLINLSKNKLKNEPGFAAWTKDKDTKPLQAEYILKDKVLEKVKKIAEEPGEIEIDYSDITPTMFTDQEIRESKITNLKEPVIVKGVEGLKDGLYDMKDIAPDKIFGSTGDEFQGGIYTKSYSELIKPVTSIELDTEGLPWDKRIHSSTKAKVQDGKWRLMRGVDPATVKRVEAELRQTMNASAPITNPVEAIQKMAKADGEFFKAITPIAASPESLVGELMQQDLFPELISKITKATAEKKITMERITEIVKQFGLPHLPAVASRPDLIPLVSQMIDEVIA